ncbi:protein lin-37 homolog isoform X2 [Xenia sp. Carnegie-2017]|uniref:protein lin-37 homolog isoform X2 n=1 Tax=Xenia sp. Carnegie-2017 TaxID=2897299 RepID=UPI001F046798|nr:protein lin-37 homolog isoform X2 [Xenia sp. Carnegie-2017]
MAGRLADTRSALDDLLKKLSEKQDTYSTPLIQDVRGENSYMPMQQPSTPRKRTTTSGNKPPRKRIKRENPSQDSETQMMDAPQQPTHICKLFDRSVDFAKFHKGTSLYTLARAWMKNKPHESVKDSNVENLTTMVGEVNSEALYSLPVPVNVGLPSCIPTPLPQTRAETWKSDNCPASSSDLLKQHITRWKEVRRRWKEASQENQRPFMTSIQMIRKLFNQQI